MSEAIVEFFTSFTGNDYLTLFLISIIPIIELRGAIVIMAGMTDINMIAGMFCCVAGSTVVILPLILLVRPLIRRLKRSKLFANIGRKMESNIADRASNAYSEKQDEVQSAMAGETKKRRKPLTPDTKKFLGLFVFVGIPLPMTGAWTGSCVGSFLDFPVWKAALAVFCGNIVAASILTLIAYFLPQQYADFFLYGFVVLAVALAVALYFARSKRFEQKKAAEMAKYGSQSEYELALLKREADENGKVLIKKEYVDENGDKHIVIGHDEKRNSSLVDDDNVI